MPAAVHLFTSKTNFFNKWKVKKLLELKTALENPITQ